MFYAVNIQEVFKSSLIIVTGSPFLEIIVLRTPIERVDVVELISPPLATLNSNPPL